MPTGSRADRLVTASGQEKEAFARWKTRSRPQGAAFLGSDVSVSCHLTFWDDFVKQVTNAHSRSASSVAKHCCFTRGPFSRKMRKVGKPYTFIPHMMSNIFFSSFVLLCRWRGEREMGRNKRPWHGREGEEEAAALLTWYPEQRISY